MSFSLPFCGEPIAHGYVFETTRELSGEVDMMVVSPGRYILPVFIFMRESLTLVVFEPFSGDIVSGVSMCNHLGFGYGHKCTRT